MRALDWVRYRLADALVDPISQAYAVVVAVTVIAIVLWFCGVI